MGDANRYLFVHQLFSNNTNAPGPSSHVFYRQQAKQFDVHISFIPDGSSTGTACGAFIIQIVISSIKGIMYFLGCFGSWQVINNPSLHLLLGKRQPARIQMVPGNMTTLCNCPHLLVAERQPSTGFEERFTHVVITYICKMLMLQLYPNQQDVRLPQASQCICIF